MENWTGVARIMREGLFIIVFGIGLGFGIWKFSLWTLPSEGVAHFFGIAGLCGGMLLAAIAISEGTKRE